MCVHQTGLFEGIADGLTNAKVMLACVSDEYAASQNCVMEFRFATSVLKIPTVLAVVGTGLQWRASEVRESSTTTASTPILKTGDGFSLSLDPQKSNDVCEEPWSSVSAGGHVVAAVADGELAARG